MLNPLILSQVDMMFARYDKNNSGNIEISELKSYFGDIGMKVSTHETNDIIKCLDINRDGRVNRQELYEGLCRANFELNVKQFNMS